MEVGEVTLVNFTLMASFSLILWAGELQCLRVGRGCDELVGSFCAAYH